MTVEQECRGVDLVDDGGTLDPVPGAQSLTVVDAQGAQTSATRQAALRRRQHDRLNRRASRARDGRSGGPGKYPEGRETQRDDLDSTLRVGVAVGTKVQVIESARKGA